MRLLSWARDGHEELYEEHVERMLSLWKTKHRKVYEAPLRRILKRISLSVDVDSVVRTMIILHDVGKLVPLYQSYLRKERTLGGYRHEVIGAVFAAHALSGEPWSRYVSAAILLHHEPILLGQVGRSGENYFTLTRAYHVLSLCSENSTVKLVDGAETLINSLLRKEGLNFTIRGEMGIDECMDMLRDIVVRTALIGKRQLIRAAVAGLLHVLVLLDALAGSFRGNDNYGTFVSRRARLAEVAEIV